MGGIHVLHVTIFISLVETDLKNVVSLSSQDPRPIVAGEESDPIKGKKLTPLVIIYTPSMVYYGMVIHMYSMMCVAWYSLMWYRMVCYVTYGMIFFSMV